MKKFKGILVAALLIMMFVPVNAQTVSPQEYIQKYAFVNNPYGASHVDGYTSYAMGRNKADTKNLMYAQLVAEYPHAMSGHPYLPEAFVTNGAYPVGYFPDTYIYTVAANEAYFSAWLPASVPIIVPQGTKQSQISKKIADWEAAALSYDWDYSNFVLQSIDLTYAQTLGMQSLTTGKGICTSYSDIFSKVMNSTSINPRTQTVDYTCSNPVYMNATEIYNKVHCYVLTEYCGSLIYVDPTYYDALGRSSVYLNLPQSVLQDADHRIG